MLLLSIPKWTILAKEVEVWLCMGCATMPTNFKGVQDCSRILKWSAWMHWISTNFVYVGLVQLDFASWMKVFFPKWWDWKNMVGYCCRGWCWLGLAMTGFDLALRKLPWRRSLPSYLCPYIWDFTASPTSGTLSCDSSGEKKCIAIVEMHGQVSEWSRVAVAIKRKSVESTRSGFQDGTIKAHQKKITSISDNIQLHNWCNWLYATSPDAGSVPSPCSSVCVCVQLFSPHTDGIGSSLWPVSMKPSPQRRAVRNAVALKLTSQALGSWPFPAVWLKIRQQRSATRIIQYNKQSQLRHQLVCNTKQKLPGVWTKASLFGFLFQLVSTWNLSLSTVGQRLSGGPNFT